MKAGLASAILCAGLVAACKPSEPTVPEGAETTWPEMNVGQRVEHMSSVVLPRMKAHFQGFDGERFADFGCPTCHGAGADSGSYEMPNPALPHLDPAVFYKKHRKQTPEMARFMWKVVEPEMAQLLGLPRGEDGFHCANCHVVEGH